jgi:S-adenosylmethionine hydrolase
VSATFHGRDLFAPVAARLAAGEEPEAFGRPVEAVTQLEWPGPTRQGESVHGEVLYVDRFGNAITNLSPADLGTPTAGTVLFEVAGHQIRGPASHYGAAEAGEPVVVLGSAGFYEVAMNMGDAAATLGLGVGASVEARVPDLKILNRPASTR